MKKLLAAMFVALLMVGCGEGIELPICPSCGESATVRMNPRVELAEVKTYYKCAKKHNFNEDGVLVDYVGRPVVNKPTAPNTGNKHASIKGSPSVGKSFILEQKRRAAHGLIRQKAFPQSNFFDKIKDANDSGATELKLLGDLLDNRISDLSPLAGLTKLESLWLSDNHVSDLSPLAGLTNLEKMYLGGNQISDLSPLAGLTNLTDLNIWGNKFTDLSPLAGLSKLEYLALGGNEISDVSSLKGLTNLWRLRLDNNQITDLSPLAGLTNLKFLKLSDNPIPDDQKAMLIKALPECNITF